MIDWMPRFICLHRKHCSLLGLPEFDSDEGRVLYRTLEKIFENERITEAAAIRASERMLIEPAPSARQHWPKLLALAKEAMRRDGPSSPDPSTREGAKLASRDCPHCSGEGLVIVWQPGPDPMRADPRAVPTCAAHCTCPHGRWIRRRLGEQDRDLLRRVPDLAEVLEGRTAWRPRNPDFAAWDRAAAMTWARTPGAERAEWRRRVRAHFPELVHLTGFVEHNAIAWCHDPALVPPAPPASAPPATMDPLRRVITRAARGDGLLGEPNRDNA
jgi:hypothetical protein